MIDSMIKWSWYEKRDQNGIRFEKWIEKKSSYVDIVS